MAITDNILSEQHEPMLGQHEEVNEQIEHMEPLAVGGILHSHNELRV